VAGKGGGGLEPGEQRRWRSIRRTGKERTERLPSKAEEAHLGRLQQDVRINPKCQVIDPGRGEIVILKQTFGAIM